jgi:hypothetical protein
LIIGNAIAVGLKGGWRGVFGLKDQFGAGSFFVCGELLNICNHGAAGIDP